jgi:hypothetical protein
MLAYQWVTQPMISVALSLSLFFPCQDEAAAATVLEKQRRSREAKVGAFTGQREGRPRCNCTSHAPQSPIQMEARNGRNERPGGGNVSMNADEMHLLTEVKALASKLAAHPEQV